MIDFSKYGFDKQKIVNGIDNNVFVKRIHSLIFLEIDEHNFATMVRKSEHTKAIHKVMIPKKIENETDLKTLLTAIGGI